MKTSIVFSVLWTWSSVWAWSQSKEFTDYWQAGKSEWSVYTLTQMRQGEVYQGSVALNYATETFSRSKQLRIEQPGKLPNDEVTVLRCHLRREFGSAPARYSLLQSVFTPTDRAANPHTLKVSTSYQHSQGHSYSQLNLQTYKYKILLRSHQESEGDQDLQIEKVLLEDEIWNLLRINPELLPDGTVSLLPSAICNHLRYGGLHPQDAECTLQNDEQNPTESIYTIHYPNHQRTLSIRFRSAFPHRILGWTENYMEGGKMQTVKAVLNE